MLRWKALTNAKMLQVNLLGLVVVAGWAVLAAAVEVPTIPRLLGASALPVPAFSEFWLSDDTSKPIVDRYTLYMSSFKPLAFAQVSCPPFHFVSSSLGLVMVSVVMASIGENENLLIEPQREEEKRSPDRYLVKTIPRIQRVVCTSGTRFYICALV